MDPETENPGAPAADVRPPAGPGAGPAEDRELTIEELVIADGEPVESFFIEKQQRLLTEALYSSWAGPGEGRPFVALSNVGLFPEKKQTPLVPDVMLAVDVSWKGRDLRRKENQSYFVWVVGKPPDLALEIVSDRRGGEDGYKLARYAKIGVRYYVIFDPAEWLGAGILRSFERDGQGKYQPLPEPLFPAVGLGLTLWDGAYEGEPDQYLRWCGLDGQLIPTGYERAEQERQRADRERQRRERLEAQLRSLGVEPPPNGGGPA